MYTIYLPLFALSSCIQVDAETTPIPKENLYRARIYSKYGANQTFDRIPQFKISKKIPVKKFKLVCYYSLPGDSNSLQIEHLDPHLCTHINAAFGYVMNNSLHMTDIQKESLKKLVDLKQVNSDLKVLVSIGGAGDEKDGFPDMVSNHSNRKTFIRSVLSFVKEFKIDGIDLDWEFPSFGQKTHFTQLLGEIRKNINKQSVPYLLTVAVAAPFSLVLQSYDVAYMNDYVDFVNLMSYDYHFYSEWTPFTGINSPLYASDNEVFIFSAMNLNFSANFWNHLGMDRAKIIIGLPTYGHTFKLANPRNNGLYAPAFGYGKLGSDGFVDYPGICKFLAINQITPIFDMEAKSPYASKFYEWVSFENTQSLTYKAEYIREQQFGGAMVWSLNNDDYKLSCQIEGRTEGKFPLIKSIKNVLFGSS